MTYILIRKYHLTPKQESILRKMVKDFQKAPINLTIAQMAEKYDTSVDMIVRIFNFLRKFNLVQRYRFGGYKYVTVFSEQINEYLNEPYVWLEKNCKEFSLGNPKQLTNQVA